MAKLEKDLTRKQIEILNKKLQRVVDEARLAMSTKFMPRSVRLSRVVGVCERAMAAENYALKFRVRAKQP